MKWETMRLSMALFIFYMLLTADTSAVNMVSGALVSAAISSVSTNVFFKSERPTRIPNIFTLCVYTVFLIFEIYKSSFLYMARIIKNDTHPVVVKVRLRTSNPFIVAAVANSITLTPGTIAIDANENTLMVLTSDGKKMPSDIQSGIKKSFEDRLGGW
ncbi:multicomponent Na+:H+ antiporter subunit E [Peptoclostridium litorale DSM 5388]|uniref:Uncharacterized protein n=1 Tax=Peptoclostridium litorale DSM 5388 TaxID=1121324 RepID=A0A069RHC8_PEPLI|nr:Na+/H+ antiporter subunit E [Peptoclostridium litorale]KDR96178.1 hypothetical protein CLIT_4c00150 [Peptoclostridium litorale DSM 5388]SIO13020.1 multicomponent Na+:H+ antiporter subunit E [Peptoclostridium litorale DSM 5388]